MRTVSTASVVASARRPLLRERFIVTFAWRPQRRRCVAGAESEDAGVFTASNEFEKCSSNQPEHRHGRPARNHFGSRGDNLRSPAEAPVVCEIADDARRSAPGPRRCRGALLRFRHGNPAARSRNTPPEGAPVHMPPPLDDRNQQERRSEIVLLAQRISS